ncbi:oligosaccharide flippase family protein [Blattabacterium cuenoti]|uniref:lipopolysaccharide biosynthesis protein n=1 Tax=Blattabacterium cuenoti TaxID=1653831 RepID=UPI00311FA63E
MYRKLVIQTIIYSIGFVFPRIVNYVFLKFFTVFFKREEFSLYTDMYALSFIVIGFLSFGLENTYFRFLYKKNYNKEIVFSTGVIIQLLISSFFLIVSINLIKYLSFIAGYHHHSEYFFMFFFIIFFDTICVLPMAWLRANDKPVQYSTINIVNILIQSFLIIYLFLYSDNIFYGKNTFFFLIFRWISSFTDKIGYIFFSNMISSLVNLFLVLPILLKEVTIKKFNKNLAIKMLNYGIPIMIGTIAFSINENLDKILIKRWVSDEINGSYSACYKIASFMSLYLRIFRLGVEPFFFKKSKDSDAIYFYEEIIYMFILFGLIFYVLICGNINIFMEFLIDKKYHVAISIIPIIMMGNLFLGIYTNLSIFYKIIDKPIIGTYISLIGVLITFLFNAIFIFISTDNSFMIPAWGTFTSYGFMLIVLYIWGKKQFLQFCNKKIKNIIMHFLFALFIVFMIKKEMELSFLLQFLYLIIIFFLEKKRLSNLIK